MADDVHYRQAEIEKFHACQARLLRIFGVDSEECRSNINAAIDQLNSLDYSLKIARDEEVNGLLCHCCKIISIKHEQLLAKYCQAINNLVVRQQAILSQAALERVVEYLLLSLKTCSPWMIGDILHSLGAVLYQNGGNVSKFYDDLLGRHGVLMQLTEGDEDHERAALQCMENMCMKTVNGTDQLPDEYVIKCYQQFLTTLHKVRSAQIDPLVHSRIIIACMKGVHNILSVWKETHLTSIGELLAALKAYTVFGLSDHSLSIPPCLYPTAMSQYDQNPCARPQPTETKQPAKTQTKKNKKKKSTDAKQKPKDRGDDDLPSDVTNATASVGALKIDSPSKGGQEKSDTSQTGGDAEAYTFVPAWRVNSSESEYSDTEGGQASRLRSVLSKVRHYALMCLQCAFKNTEKRITFGYWSHFIPDATNTANSSQTYTLFTVIFKDPNPKVRTAALAALSALVEGSKQYLAAADDREHASTPFTPFFTVLGSMIKELHRCLLLALVAENSPLTVTQLIKCIGTVIPNVPYQKMRPGLLSRVVKQIKPFIHHRDPNIRVACLTCFGAMVSVQAPLLEVCHILNMSKSVTQASATDIADIEAKQSDAAVDSVSPGITTPNSASGTATPTLSDVHLQPGNTEVSWVIKLCVKNITSNSKLDCSLNVSFTGRMGIYEPLPIKLESLQVLANLTKGYFPFVKSHLLLFGDVIIGCLEDKDPSVQLHGAKLLHVLGNTVLQKNQDAGSSQPHVSLSQAEEFWLRILNGPLPAALQNPTNAALRATGCDCVSTIGPSVFKLLDVGKRMMCITLLLGLASDDDGYVRAAAVRALGVYVLYPCLREDVSFVADCANAVINCMDDRILAVRMKAAWSLGTLSDALVLNKDEDDGTFLEDFSDMLLLTLFSVATKASHDNDKVKSNAVRSLGNFLRYAHPRFLGKGNVRTVIEQAAQALVKTIGSGAMKVRWNACYAVGNVFKNDLLPLGTASWTGNVFTALCAAIHDCKNFKVRINAAMSISVPETRQPYGLPQQYAHIWSSLLKAAENAEDITDFAEYKYRDNLTDQICTTLIHCVKLVTAEDLSLLHTVLQKQAALVSKLISAYCQGEQKQERVHTLQECIFRLESLGSMSSDAQASLFLLLRVLKPQDTEVEGMTGFRPTYD